jgi:hypothetical protein
VILHDYQSAYHNINFVFVEKDNVVGWYQGQLHVIHHFSDSGGLKSLEKTQRLEFLDRFVNFFVVPFGIFILG